MTNKRSEYDYKIISDGTLSRANALVLKYKEHRHIDPGAIIFVENHASRDKKNKLAKITKISAKWRDILWQKGAPSYFYMIEFYHRSCKELSETQKTALLYRELRRIGPEGDVHEPDTSDWYDLIEKLGHKWSDPDSVCPDLLKEDLHK